MNTPRTPELQVASERAAGWVQYSASADRSPTHRDDCMAWLLESPLHVREALAALAWEDEFRTHFAVPSARPRSLANAARANGPPKSDN